MPFHRGTPGFEFEPEAVLASLDGEFARIMSTTEAIERLRHG